MHVINGGRPERPTVGFSDALWKLLEQSWNYEHESMLPMRPPISLLRTQLERDGRTWFSVIGMSGTITPVGSCIPLSLKWTLSDIRSPQADDTTPLPAASDADPDLQVLLEQVHEFLRLKRPATAPTPVVVPAPAPSPGPSHRAPREFERGKRAKTHVRRGSFKKIREKFRLLLTKFGRASREPITLSDGLIPEHEENAEVAEKRYAGLFD